MSCASSAWGRSMSRIACRPISTSSPHRNSPGSCFRRIYPRSRSTTSATSTGRRKASSAVAIYVMQITPATLEDARQVAEIHVTTWQSAYQGILPAEYLASLSVEKHEAMWRESTVKGVPELFVAKVEGGMVGWVAFGS